MPQSTTQKSSSISFTHPTTGLASPPSAQPLSNGGARRPTRQTTHLVLLVSHNQTQGNDKTITHSISNQLNARVQSNQNQTLFIHPSSPPHTDDRPITSNNSVRHANLDQPSQAKRSPTQPGNDCSVPTPTGTPTTSASTQLRVCHRGAPTTSFKTMSCLESTTKWGEEGGGKGECGVERREESLHPKRNADADFELCGIRTCCWPWAW